MTSLAQLPPEIISMLSTSLNGFDIGHLWLSGDGMLMTRLEVGVTRFELSLAQTTSCCWPKLISQFKRLLSLSIRPRDDYHRIWFREVDFYGISSSLKHLELEFDNLEFSLFGLPFVVPDAHPDPIWSPPTEGDMVFSPFPMAIRFPHLETVRLGGELKFPEFLLPMLPPSLLSLRLPYGTLDAFDINRLPPALTWLELPRLNKIENEKIELKFPANISHLNIALLTFSDLKVTLPSTLTYLSTMCDSVATYHLPKVPLAPTLVHLRLNGYSPPKGAFVNFPPGLRHLIAPGYGLSLSQENLPVDLQTLAICPIQARKDTSPFVLPSTLTSISLGFVRVPAASFLSFPSSLRSLSIEVKLSHVGTIFPFMHTLEKLQVRDADVRILHYAPKLKKLRIWEFVSQSMPLRLDKLQSLTNLRVTSFGHNWRDTEVHYFPERLEKLEFPSLSPNAYQSLPRGLTSLHISQDYICNEMVAHLPPGLTELRVKNEEKTISISDAAIALLPRTVMILELDHTYELTDIGISHLPRNMKSCSLGKTPLLTDRSTSLFPRQLQTLYLEGVELLSNACIKHLPRTLTCLALNQAIHMEEGYISDLPPRLDYSPDISDAIPDQWEPIVSKTEQFLLALRKEAQDKKLREISIRRRYKAPMLVFSK